MSWDKQKLLLVSIVGLLLVFLAFVIGVAFGASSSKNEFLSLILPILSMVGSWASGLGALMAVIVALWLAEQQRKREQEHLKVEFQVVVIPPKTSEEILAINIVSDGGKPSVINSITIHSDEASCSMYLHKFMQGSDSIRKTLGYGETAVYMLEYGFENHIADYLRENGAGAVDSLKVYVSTTTKNFLCIPSESVTRKLESIMGREPNNG